MTKQMSVIQPQNTLVSNEEAFKKKAMQYLTTMGYKLPEWQKEQFLELSALMGLNPFSREIYAVPFGNAFQIVVSYNAYIAKAEQTRLCTGWQSGVLKKENGEIYGCVTIHRKDWTMPFVHEVPLKEYSTGKGLWATKPETMIKKVAIAQGFRLCFPNDFRHMSYCHEEMERSFMEAEVTSEESKSLASIQKALDPLGIELIVENNVAFVRGNGVFVNNTLIKNLGFVFNKANKRWEMTNFTDDRDVQEVAFEEVTSTQDLQAPKVETKSLADFCSTKNFQEHMDNLGLSVEFIEHKDIRWAKISGVAQEHLELMHSLGGIERGSGIYAVDVTSLSQSLDLQDLQDALF